MDRRGFLRGLFGASALVAVPAAPVVKYFFAPQGGWRPGLFTCNSASGLWVSKSAEEIFRDLDEALSHLYEARLQKMYDEAGYKLYKKTLCEARLQKMYDEALHVEIPFSLASDGVLLNA
jgi:hypothetical protein